MFFQKNINNKIKINKKTKKIGEKLTKKNYEKRNIFKTISRRIGIFGK